MTNPKPRLKGLYVMDDDIWPEVYDEAVRQAISAHVNVDHPQLNAARLREHLDLLEDVDVLLLSWGAPVLDAEVLRSAPRLKAVFYAAGSVRNICTREFWERGLPIVSAKRQIARQVADFTEAVIYLSLKHAWACAIEARNRKEWVTAKDGSGISGSTIGVVSLGAVGQAVCQRLAGLEYRVIAFDPYADEGMVQAVGVELVNIQELFSRADVVTLHAPSSSGDGAHGGQR